MEDLEALNDTVNSIETNVDEIGTKVANNANALVEVNITITNFLSKKKICISLFVFSMPYLLISLQVWVYLKKGPHILSKL